MPQAQKHFGFEANVVANASSRGKLLIFGLTNTYPSTWDGMKVNIKGL